jgi:integrase
MSNAKNVNGSMVPAPTTSTRKRGKCMSRRCGQNPEVRVGKRADGSQFWFFQYYVDVAGQQERQRKTEVVGDAGQMDISEARRCKVDFLQKLGVNSPHYRIPSEHCFAGAIQKYREKATTMLRASTLSMANIHISKHLEPDWASTPIDNINLTMVNEWAWKKRREGLSWVTIKNILRTMQRVLTVYTGERKHPPFCLKDLSIPEKDKLAMEIATLEADSFSWTDTKRIADAVLALDGLNDSRKARYATAFLLAAASGLRCSELFALRMNDVDFKASTLRVDEAFDGRTYTIGQVKNLAAHRKVVLGDREGREAMRKLKAFIKGRTQNPTEFLFHSKNGSPMRETKVLHEALHPALKALGLPKAGMHAFRRGCNRRWELAGVNPAATRQMMGHSSSAMTARYSGRLPIEAIQADFSRRNGPQIVVSENKRKMKNRRAA